MINTSGLMNSRPYHQFQLQAAEAAAAAASLPPPVHAADDVAPPEPPTPKALLLELVEAQVTAEAPPPVLPLQQGSGVAPMGVGIAEPTKCPECPKWFVSEKAMFGHLRKHPERGYKGATRPATFTSAAAALAGEKMPKKPPQLARNEVADVSAMNLVAAAATAGKKKKPWQEAAELSIKWPATAMRGHAPFAAVAAGKQQASSDDEDEEAAMILLGMASSSHSTTSVTQQASVQQLAVHAPDAASRHQFPDVEHQPMLLGGDHVTGDHLMMPPLEAEQIVQPAGIVIELSAESQTPSPAVKEITNVDVTAEALKVVVVSANKPVAPGSSSGGGASKKAKKQPRGVVYLEHTAAAAAKAPAPPPEGGSPAVWRMPLPASNKRHVCPTCGKWFSTYQALGGHMSSHVKAKAGAAAVHEELAAAQARHNILAHRTLSGGGGGLVLAAGAAGAGAGWGQQGLHLQDVHHQPPALMAATVPHVCFECRMTFPSGQALGGHKRKHWFPEKHQAKAAASAAEPAAPPPAAVPAPRDFDLNELPEGEGENEQP
ncbi:unnamed protein product [Urochloa humidicola]